MILRGITVGLLQENCYIMGCESTGEGVIVDPGDNAHYTIVRFAGVRIMDVKLTGNPSKKRVTVQPAPVITKGAIPSDDQTSSFVFSPVWLVR